MKVGRLILGDRPVCDFAWDFAAECSVPATVVRFLISQGAFSVYGRRSQIEHLLKRVSAEAGRCRHDFMKVGGELMRTRQGQGQEVHPSKF